MKVLRSAAGYSLCAAMALVTGLVATPATATEGYFQHGYGTISRGMAGTGVAYSQEAMTQALNPAGLIYVGDEINLAMTVFVPRRQVTGSGASPPGFIQTGELDSRSKLFLIPSFAWNHKVQDNLAVGIALYGNGGMNSNWEAVDRSADVAFCGPGGSGVFCFGKAGVDLSQLFVQASVAYEVADGLSLGVGPIFAVQSFAAEGLTAFSRSSSEPSKLTGNGHDLSYGVGGRIGMQAQLPGNVRFGAAYQFRTYMSRLDKYRGLFAEQGDFDIPPAFQAGFAWKATPALTLLADYRRIWYSDVAAVGNPFSSPGRLGDDNGQGFGWTDVDVFKLGVQYVVTDKLTVRAGWSHGDNPIGSSEVLFNILAPAVIEDHLTAGLSYDVTETSTLNVSTMYALKGSVTGPNPNTPGQDITLEMDQFELTVGWTWRF